MRVERVFLEGGGPFAERVVDWLWERREDLPALMVLVPTAQSIRRIQRALAEKGGVLSPVFTTPGSLLGHGKVASATVEMLAWMEVLEEVSDRSFFKLAFGSEPQEGLEAGWTLGISRALQQTRQALQEKGMMLRDAVEFLEGSPEEVRWRALAALEEAVEGLLEEWGFRSKSAWLSEAKVEGLELSSRIQGVVLAGVFDLPEVLSSALEAGEIPVQVLLPELARQHSDAWGRPQAGWLEEPFCWPEPGSVTLEGDFNQQAECAVRLIAKGGRPSNEVAIGTADDDLSPVLVNAFGRAGWVVFDPGAQLPMPVQGWLRAFAEYLRSHEILQVIDLLAFSESEDIVGGKRGERVKALRELQDRYLIRNREGIVRRRSQLEMVKERKEWQELELEACELALGAVESFSAWRDRFFREGFHWVLRDLLPLIDPGKVTKMVEWIGETEPLVPNLKRTPNFWLDLLLQLDFKEAAEPPADRVLDSQGWLELIHEPAAHLVLCGMNEGRVPARITGNQWLPEATRRTLGLVDETTRAARDAFLLRLYCERERTDLIVGKTNLSGDVLRPSRLLLAAKGKELARRVKQLFAEVGPADIAVAWEREERWKWVVPELALPKKIRVTAFKEYLSCPFRFYLSQVLKMKRPEPSRTEWSRRDFGNVMHLVLENWGRDLEARELSEVTPLREWLFAELERVLVQRLGKQVPLAVLLQKEALSLRLRWFAEVQAGLRQDGWRVQEVEKDFQLTLGGMNVSGQIDRIDRHEDGRVRVLDYKTSAKAKDPVKEHLIKPPRVMPRHLEGVAEVISPDGGKLWRDVQLPLYAHALGGVQEAGYFSLAETKPELKLSLWDDLDVSELESAVACAEWVTGRIQAGEFFPPVKKPLYDDYLELAMNRPLEDAISSRSPLSA